MQAQVRPIETPLSARTEAVVDRLFPEASLRERVRQELMVRCGTGLPMSELSTPEELERLRFAALKLAGGRFQEFVYAVQLSNIDWRDVLLAAGFGSDLEAHEQWSAQVLAQNPPGTSSGNIHKE